MHLCLWGVYTQDECIFVVLKSLYIDHLPLVGNGLTAVTDMLFLLRKNKCCVYGRLELNIIKDITQ